MDKLRVGFIGAGRNLGPARDRVPAEPAGRDRGCLRRRSRRRGAAGAGVGGAGGADLHPRRGPAGRRRGRPRRGPPAAPPPRAGDPGRTPGRQAGLGAEAHGDEPRRRRGDGRGGGRRRAVLQAVRELRLLPAGREGEGVVDAGAIGEPLFVRIKSNFGNPRHGWPVPVAARDWRLDPERCGGGPIVFDDGHHKFALAWWFMGMPEDVHAWIGTTAVEGGTVDGPAVISFRFPGDRMGVFEAVHSATSWSDPPLRAGRPGRDHRHRRASSGSPAATARSATGRRCFSTPTARRADSPPCQQVGRIASPVPRGRPSAPCLTASRPA